MENTDKNLGVILGQRDTDWVAGANSDIEYEVLNPSGDWTPWLPDGEWQRIGNLDLMACVTFSGENVLETLHNFHTGQKINFSDRFNAFLSGTTPQGNWLWKVGDSFRKDGLVLETSWPAPANQFPTWGEYYIPPTINVINEGKKFLDEWDINYEFIDWSKESLAKHLKQAPIQVVFPDHAVMLFNIPQAYQYFDSYAPFIKERQEGFVSALKYVMTRKNTMARRLVKSNEPGSKDVYWIREVNNPDGSVQKFKDQFINGDAFTTIDGRWNAIESIPQSELDAIADGKVLVVVNQE